MAAILSDIKTPFINEATLKRVMSNQVKDNIFQNVFAKPGEAVTEKFSTDTMAAQIQVIRVKPDGVEARQLGADNNGGWFNSENAGTPTTEAYGINIIDVIDNCRDIPTNQQDMMNVDLAAAELTNLAGKVSRNINAITIAAQLAKNFNDIADGAATNWVTVSGENYLDAIIEAGAKLDEGNPAQGIDAYPDDQRALFIRPSAKAALLKSGQLIIGGSNYAQDIIRNGGLDVETNPAVATTGYLGTINNIPVYSAAPIVWATAEKYLGLAPGALDDVYMLAVSAIGTGRALAFNEAIKTIPSPAGQGIRIQPKYRFGAECWDYKSVVPIVDGGFGNPAATTRLTVMAPASRG